MVLHRSRAHAASPYHLSPNYREIRLNQDEIASDLVYSSRTFHLEDNSHHRHERHLRTPPGKQDLDKVLSESHAPLSAGAYLSLLTQCNRIKSLQHSKHVHSHLIQYRIPLTGFLGDYLAMVLANCGAISDADQILKSLPCRTVFSWTALISSYVDHGYCIEALETYEAMRIDGVKPNTYTFVSVIRACGNIPDLAQGKVFHEEVRQRSFTSNIFVVNTLISMYGKCGSLSGAEDVFSESMERDVVSWNSMLSAYVEQEQGRSGLLLFRQMQDEGIVPNKLTIIVTLQACCTLVHEHELLIASTSAKQMSYDIGQTLHAIAWNRGYVSDTSVSTALLHMYGNCGAVSESEHVFSALSIRDIISWTALLSAYVEQCQATKSLQLFKHMQQEGIKPNQLTFGIVLQACHMLAREESYWTRKMPHYLSLEIGKALHLDAYRKGFTSDLIVGNPLISMYSKCKAPIGDAENVFHGLLHRNIVSWNVMLSAYVELGEAEKALELYNQMRQENVSPNKLTFIAILQACSVAGNLAVCRQLHSAIISIDYDRAAVVMATLIHAYGNCACMIDALTIFHGLSDNSLIFWNACIAGYAREGDYLSSVDMYDELKLTSIKPDEVTFTSLLSSCSHSGLTLIGLKHFISMSSIHGLSPDSKHFGIIADLFGRAGNFTSLKDMLEKIDIKDDLTIWSCVLNACRIHGNVAVAKETFDQLINLQPSKGSAYVLMSNICAEAGWEDLTLEC